MKANPNLTLETLGIDGSAANLFERLLPAGLLPSVAAAALVCKTFQPGDWVIDAWPSDNGVVYDSVLQILRVNSLQSTVVGVEYDYAPNSG